MKHYEFCVKMRPQPKERPRFNRGKVYTPKKTVTSEKYLAFHAKQHIKEMISTPCNLAVTFTFATKDIKRVGTPHSIRPDLDNLIKLVKDALKSIAYPDDCMVVNECASKVWGLEDKIDITISG